MLVQRDRAEIIIMTAKRVREGERVRDRECVRERERERASRLF